MPSRILLDDPFPANLPVVSACSDCNQGFSKDEEYLACLLEVVLTGSSTVEPRMRPKVQRILAARPLLAARIGAAGVANPGGLFWDPEFERVANVIVKLAQGHAAFELSEPQIDAPNRIAVSPLLSMSEEQRTEFENVHMSCLWPEVGSRAMRRIIEAWPDALERWIVVQPERYRYLTSYAQGVTVRIVLSEYLACEVRWD